MLILFSVVCYQVEGQKCVNIPVQQCSNVPVSAPVEVPKEKCYKRPRKVCQTLVSTKPKVVTAQVPREHCGHKNGDTIIIIMLYLTHVILFHFQLLRAQHLILQFLVLNNQQLVPWLSFHQVQQSLEVTTMTIETVPTIMMMRAAMLKIMTNSKISLDRDLKIYLVT